MGSFPAIDTDGHIIERDSDIRKYLEAPVESAFNSASTWRSAVGFEPFRYF